MGGTRGIQRAKIIKMKVKVDVSGQLYAAPTFRRQRFT
jgi:hypothetical protein